MSNTNVRRIGIVAAIMALLLIGSGAFVGSVAAQSDTDDPCVGPENIDNCEGGKSQYTDMLDNVYTIAHITLQYLGFIAVFLGAALWFTARRSSERAQTGLWLFAGGLIMIVFYFGMTAFVSLLRWIAEGSG